MYAQQGHFLATNIAHLEGFLLAMEKVAGKKALIAVDVPVSDTTEALKDLAFMGLTAAPMFPGLDGVSRMIKHHMSFTACRLSI